MPFPRSGNHASVDVSAVKRRLDGDWGERAGRAGLAARGVMYAIVGMLAVRVALGDSSQRADKGGAFAAVAHQPLGRVLLAILALGLGGYAAWRLAQAFLDRDGEGWGWEGLAKRGGSLARGLWYGGIAAFAASRVFVADEPSGSGTERRVTADVLGWPGGRLLVGAAAFGLLVAAGYNGYRALTQRFERKLRKGRMSKGERGAARGVGILGHLARMTMFGLVGLFLARAAWEHEAREARGLDAAIAEVADEVYGTVVIGALGVGLIGFGIYSLVEARYRDV